MADTFINLRDDSTHVMYPIKLFDLHDGTYLTDLAPFMVMRADSFVSASITIGEEVTANKSKGYHRKADITIGEEVTVAPRKVDYHRVSNIEIGEKVTAKRRIAVTRKSFITIGEAIKMFVIIPAPGWKTLIYNRTFKTLDFIKKLIR